MWGVQTRDARGRPGRAQMPLEEECPILGLYKETFMWQCTKAVILYKVDVCKRHVPLLFCDVLCQIWKFFDGETMEIVSRSHLKSVHTLGT